jgi:DNA-binding IclR family transcriptional regulator
MRHTASGSKPLDPQHPGRYSSSLVAGLAMLACFTAENHVRGIADMADALELGRSTTHRYASTLVTLGYLEQTASRQYLLSPRVADIGLSLLDSMTIRRVAREHLRNLRHQTGRTVCLGVLKGAELVYIDRWQGSRQGQYAADVGVGLGTHQPIHCTAAGKALLACLPAAEQQKLMAKLRLRRRTPKTIVTKGALRAELERIVSEGGVAVEDEELHDGRCALAAVVPDTGDRLIATVELTVPVQAYTRNELTEQFGPKATATARGIGEALAESLQEASKGSGG